MSQIYTTIVKTSPDFIDKLLRRSCKSILQLKGKLEMNEITIQSKDFPTTNDVMRLSHQFPDEVFTAITTSDNYYVRIAYVDEYSKGTGTRIREDLVYYFSINPEHEKKLNVAVYKDFKMRVENYFNWYNYISEYHKEEDIHGYQEPIIKINHTLEFTQGNVCIKATRIELTYIKVEVEFFGED